MAEKSELLDNQFNGKNYFSWELQFHMFVKGRELWGCIDSTTTKSKDETNWLNKKPEMPGSFAGY